MWKGVHQVLKIRLSYDRIILCLQVCKSTFQPGDFIHWGSEGVKALLHSLQHRRRPAAQRSWSGGSSSRWRGWYSALEGSSRRPASAPLDHWNVATVAARYVHIRLLLSLPSNVNSRHFSSQNISVRPHCPSLPSVCTVCVCVCVCVCACVCVCVCVHLLHNYAWTLVDIYIIIFWIKFSILMYIMCVFIMFSTLSFTNFIYYYYEKLYLMAICFSCDSMQV